MRKGFVTASLLAAMLGGLPAVADDAGFTNLMGRVPTSNEIVEGLTPLGIRLEPVAPVADERQPILANTPDVSPVEPAATVALEVRFDFDSAVLTPQARTVLTQLATALKAPALSDSAFLIEGHTDARGSDVYNQSLSERRANAVLDFLTREQGVELSRLIAVGRGEAELLQPQAPASGENRRVEVANLGAQKNAQLVR